MASKRPTEKGAAKAAPFSDGVARFAGDDLPTFLARLLREGRHREAADLLTPWASSTSPPGFATLAAHRQMLGVLVPWLRGMPEKSRVPGKRGRPGPLLSPAHAEKVRHARLVLRLAINARLLLDAKAPPSAAAAASFMASYGEPGDVLDAARDVLKTEGLETVPRRGFRAVYRERIAEKHGVAESHLKGIGEICP